MFRCGMEVKYWTYYILVTYCCLFQNVYARNPCHKSDHYMVLGCLHGDPQWEHSRYLGQRQWLPMYPM